jgi:hypothetical protein
MILFMFSLRLSAEVEPSGGKGKGSDSICFPTRPVDSPDPVAMM